MSELDEQLFEACRAEPVELQRLRELLARGARPAQLGYSGNILYGDVLTGLHMIGLCRDNPVEAAELLLDAGAELDARSERHGWTPLHLACAWNHLPVVRLLLDRGAEVDAIGLSYKPETPLVCCINANAELCMPTVELLLARGADPNLRPDKSESPLETAVGARNLAVVGALLAGGADPNGSFKHRPPLFRAVTTHEGADLIRALLDAGAHIDVRSGGGRRPIHEALLRTELEHLDLLLERGAQIDARDKDGLTPLMTWLSWHARPTPIALVEAVIARGSDLVACDAAGTPTLHYALRKGEAAVVRMLVEAGADPAQRDAQGQTALELARELNPLLVAALGQQESHELAPPTELALQGLRSGMELACASGTLRADSWQPEIGRAKSINSVLIREQLAWTLLQVPAHADVESICALINAVAAQLEHPARSHEELLADLRARESELVARCELELRPEHAGMIIEEGVRAGYEPVRSDKEGFWVWRYVGGPEAEAFEFKEAGEHLPQGRSRRTDGADLRRFFSGFDLELGRLQDWKRKRLDAALNKLGFESERQWLAARAAAD